MWSHARAPLRKDGKSVCTAICKWFIFKSVWPKVEQNRPIKQSKIKYDLVFMDWMDWWSYNRSRYEVNRIDAKPGINLMVLKCSMSGNFSSTNFSSNLNENWKIRFSFNYYFLKNIIFHTPLIFIKLLVESDICLNLDVRNGLKTHTVLGRNETRQ